MLLVKRPSKESVRLIPVSLGKVTAQTISDRDYGALGVLDILDISPIPDVEDVEDVEFAQGSVE